MNTLEQQKTAAQVATKLTGVLVPYVGMGASMGFGGDSYPYEIIEVKTPKKVIVRAMDARRIDNNGYGGEQEYEYSSNENGATYVVTLRKDGRWKVEKSTQNVYLGTARYYQDPSF